MSGALSRTRPRLAKEANMAMSKWWKKKRPAEAEITMHLSPHEQQPVLPWLRTFPKKCVDRFPTYLWPIGTVGIVWVTMAWSESTDQLEDYVHRF